LNGRYEVRLAGTGGQGLIFAGIILAEAAGVYGGLHVCSSQAYGIVSRGGESRSELVISEEEIDFPAVEKADLLVAFSQDAFDRFAGETKTGGIIVVDSNLVKVDLPAELETINTIALPLARVALEKAGSELFANVVTLGVISVVSEVFRFGHIEKALGQRGATRRDANLKALAEGRELGRNLAAAKV
jgi:2-oxoglutarate ferredoxin oxidoreductase subunit gamma